MESSYLMVSKALECVSSQDVTVLKPAEAKLREWEVQPGFYSLLFNVLSNSSMATCVRFQAVVYLKNGVDKYWRKNSPNGISEQEKNMIKQGLISDFSETVNQIAVQKAVVISRIARIECPNDWPQLFPTLIQAIESSNSMVQQRSLLVLHHVVKALSAKRLAGDRKMFQEFTTNIFKYILNLWNSYTEAFLISSVKNSETDVITNLEKALLCLRILRKLSAYGFNRPHTNEDCMTFLKMIFERAKTALEFRKQLTGNRQYLNSLCEKFTVHLTKVLFAILTNHPYSFIDLMHPTLEFCIYYLFTPDGEQYLFERFVIQCFNLIGNILLCVEYKAAKHSQMSKVSESIRASDLKKDFFKQDLLTVILKKIVSHYFILTREELDMWDSDSESFVNDEGGENWKYSLRPCIETVFVTIFHEFHTTLAPVLLDMIRETNYLVAPDDMPRILQKDAVYNAVSLAAYDLYDELDFDQWFATTLVQELKVKHNNYRILRRRTIALIGKWTGIKLSSQNRPLLYECIISLLGTDEDMAVRLTASSTLRYAIDDFEFTTRQFQEYVDPCFNLLFSLLKEASECETKMHVLNVMALMVERVGQTIQPQSDALIHYLPLLWDESGEHNMLRCAIVATLVQLVKALGSVSADLNPFLLPIIQLGTDTNQQAIVYLLEDSLELWLTVLENSTTMTSELMQLFNNMAALLDYSSENLRICLLIIMAQVLLAPELVMRIHGVQIITMCDSIMADMRSEGVIMLTRLIETFVRAATPLGAQTVMPILPRIFHKICEGEEYPMIMTMYLVILSRVLLSSHQVFSQILNTLASYENETDQDVLGKILDMFLKKMTFVSQLDHRKVLALALTNLLTTQSRPVLARFGMIMVNILESLNDITKYDDSGVSVDSLVMNEAQTFTCSDDQNDDYETDHDQRKKQLIMSDPVHNIVLKDYLQSQLCELRNQLGTTTYEQLIQTVDNDSLCQLKDYITF